MKYDGGAVQLNNMTLKSSFLIKRGSDSKIKLTMNRPYVLIAITSPAQIRLEVTMVHSI